jgi:cell division transport system ATP-binding protein
MEKSPVLSLRNASIVQGSHRVLSDVNLEVAAGEFIYVIGATGSGKSSLLKTLYADLPLESGTGSIVGYDLRNLPERDIPYLRRQLGIVFQDFQLLRATGQLNRSENDDRIDNVLRRVGMPTKGHKMPHQLSGGEQQRVSIARALLNDPPLILADEPTGNLDPHMSEELMHLLEEIRASGRSILMATHDYALLLKFPHATYRCANGTLASTVQRTL